MIMQGGIHAEKAVVSYPASAGYHYMRGNEYMIPNNGVMADVIAAPQDYIAADLNKRLDIVTFKYETVIAYFQRIPRRRL